MIKSLEMTQKKPKGHINEEQEAVCGLWGREAIVRCVSPHKLPSASQHWRTGPSSSCNYPFLAPSFIPTTNIYLVLLCADNTKINKFKKMVGGIPQSYWSHSTGRKAVLFSQFIRLSSESSFFPPHLNNKRGFFFSFKQPHFPSRNQCYLCNF